MRDTYSPPPPCPKYRSATPLRLAFRSDPQHQPTAPVSLAGISLRPGRSWFPGWKTLPCGTRLDPPLSLDPPGDEIRPHARLAGICLQSKNEPKNVRWAPLAAIPLGPDSFSAHDVIPFNHSCHSHALLALFQSPFHANNLALGAHENVGSMSDFARGGRSKIQRASRFQVALNHEI